MKTRFMMENPDEIEATLKITMSLKKWGNLRDQLSNTYPSWELSAAIADLLGQAREIFYPKVDEE